MDRNPFLPIRLRTAEGASYRITLPCELAFFGPPSRKFVVLGGQTQIPVESVEAFDLESVPDDFAVSGNGTGLKMTIEKFDESLKRRPFVPFTVHVADGGSFEVKGPEFASRTQNGRTIFVSTGGENTEWIDLLLVTRISSGVNNPSVSAKKK
jgi:hypothetical protein